MGSLQEDGAFTLLVPSFSALTFLMSTKEKKRGERLMAFSDLKFFSPRVKKEKPFGR